MNKKSLKIISKILLVFLVGLVITSAIGLIAGAFGASIMAMAAVAGSTVTTENVTTASPELNMDTILKKITTISPGRAPLDTIMRRVGRSVPTKSTKVWNYNVVERPFQDTVKTQYTTILSAKSAVIDVTNPGQWTKDSTVLFQDTNNTGIVTEVNYAAGAITVSLVDNETPDGVADFPTVDAGVNITRMAPALSELQANTPAFAEIPTKEYNYCQKFGCKISESLVQEKIEKEVRWGFAEITKMRIKKMREEQELTAWIGQRGSTLRTRNSEVETVYTMGGVTRFAGKQLTYGTGAGNRTFNDDTMTGLMKDIFTGNAGSEKRYGFYGADFGKYLYGISTWEKIMKANETEITPGLTFTNYRHNFGSLYMIYHPLFDVIGYSEKMAIVDLDYLVKSTLFPMSITNLETIKTGTEDSKSKMIKETSSLLTLYPEVHAIISPKV